MTSTTAVEGSQGSEDCEECHEGVVAEMNVTPLTDVFLVLLIIFMVTSTSLTQSKAVADSAVPVTPPRAEGVAPLAGKSPVVLTVTRGGDLYLGRRKIALGDLQSAIGRALSDGATDTVLLRGDTSAQLGTAVRAMAIARKAGARNIQVLTAPGDAN